MVAAGFASLGLLCVAAIAGPIGLWLDAAIVVVWLSRILLRRLGETSGEQPWYQRLAGAALDAVKSFAKTIALATGCVLFSQFVLRGLSLASARVLRFEDMLYVLRHRAEKAMDWFYAEPAMVAVGIIILLAALWPRLRIPERAVRAQRLVARALTGLAVVTSFSFFTEVCLKEGEPDWIARRFPELKEEQEHAKKELRAARVVNEGISELSREERRRLADFLYSAGHYPVVVRSYATSLASGSNWCFDHSQGQAPDAAAAADPSAETSPGIQDFVDASEELGRLEQALRDARVLVGVALGNALHDSLPPPHPDVVARFSSTLIRALSRHAANEIFPHESTTLAKVALWAQLTLTDPNISWTVPQEVELVAADDREQAKLAELFEKDSRRPPLAGVRRWSEFVVPVEPPRPSPLLFPGYRDGKGYYSNHVRVRSGGR